MFLSISMRSIIRHLVAVVVLLVGGVFSLSAQELRLGVDFITLFDNKEYASMSYDESGTLFSSRLTPKFGVAWADNNELMFAVDMVQDFGHHAKFLSDVNVELYYAYRSTNLNIFAGIFPRQEMRGLQSPLFFDRSYRYYNNRIGGVLARYEDPNFGDSYVEFAMDYTGMRDFDTREAFMIMSSGRMPVRWFYMGYDFLMGHYAKDYNPDTDDGVVDNLLLTPYIGFNLSAPTAVRALNFDFRFSYVQSMQRDRAHENVWQFPMGGELYAEVEWYDVRLSNRLYMGVGSLYTYYDRYGSELYHGQPMYRTEKGIYDAISLSYLHSFFERTVSVEAGITVEYDGTGWGTRQWLQLNVDLDYGINLERRQQYIE